jgi:hypothetical protein
MRPITQIMKYLANSSLQVKSLFLSPFNSRNMVSSASRFEPFVADVGSHAYLVDLVDGFRPFLGHSIGIQSICQSDVRTAEIVSAETESSQMIFFRVQTTHYHRRNRARSNR